MKIGKTRFVIDGEEVTEAEFNRRRKFADGIPFVPKTFGEGNPQPSLAMACHPDQIAESNRELAEAGIVGTRYVLDKKGHMGIPQHTSRKARKAFHKFCGVFDQDAGYSDHAGK